VSVIQEIGSNKKLKRFEGNILKITNTTNLSTSREISQKFATMKPEFERLPKSVTPSHYDLQLTPDLAKFTFAGSSKTSIKVSRGAAGTE
jgi:hypothetical protein